MRAGVYLTITVAIVFALLGACAPGVATVEPTKPVPSVAPTAAPELAAPKIKRGGTLRLGYDRDYPTMDLHLSSMNLHCQWLIYNSLVTYNLDQGSGRWEVGPELVETWDFVDPVTLVLHLRRGVKFQDGSDFNAEVAKWNIERMKTHRQSYAKAQVKDIKSVDIIDPYTVKVNLFGPSAAQLVMLTRAAPDFVTGIVSKAAVEKLGDDEFGRKPVGTGPMQFVEWVTGDHVTVRKFDGYWEKGVDGQALPYLDGTVCRFKPDPTVALLEVRAENLDITIPVDPKDAAGLQADPNIVYLKLPYGQSRIIGMNPAAGPFANNLKLRQAVMHGVDRAAMAGTLLFGVGGPVYYYWLKGQPGYDETLPRYEYQPEKSKQLVTEAGLPAGIDVTFSLIYRPMDQRIAEMVQAMLKPAGIRLTLEALERVAWISKVKDKKYEMASWIFSFYPDPGMKLDQIGCDGPANWGGYCNKQFDECMTEGDRTLDRSKREEIYKRCQTIFYNDAYEMQVFTTPNSVAYRKYVNGLKNTWEQFDVRSVWLDK